MLYLQMYALMQHIVLFFCMYPFNVIHKKYVDIFLLSLKINLIFEYTVKPVLRGHRWDK